MRPRELQPLWLRLREIILTSGKIAVDETVAPVLDPGRGRTKKGFFWAIVRDDRPWSSTDPRAVAYTYAQSFHSSVPFASAACTTRL